MASSHNKFLIKTIESLTPDDFAKLVAIFERSYLSAEEIIDIDGANDGGCDIKIFKGKAHFKRCVQLTTQKNISFKFPNDLEKANKRITENLYSEVFEYFWSQTISEDKLEEYKTLARVNYGINLEFYDAKIIAGINNIEVKNFLYGIHGVPTINKIPKIEHSTKILFDLLAIGNNSSDIKNNLISSLIIFYVFEKKEASISDICNNIRTQINSILPDELIKIQINKLRTDQRLISNSNDKQCVLLSNNERILIEDITKQSDLIQSDFEERFSKILQKYNQEDNFDNYYKYLEKLYKSYYQLDIDEAENKLDYNDGVNKVFLEFQNYISQNIDDKNKVYDLISELKVLCSDNDYINKICLTSSFTSLYKSNKLEAYLEQSNKDIYIDTPLLVFALCKYYSEYSEKWDDTFFRATSSLLDLCDQYNNKFVIYTTYDYIKETAGELQKALKLAYFLDFDFLVDIGEIKNSFINFYRFLESNELFDSENINDFVDFVLDMGFENINPDDPNFITDTISRLVEYVESLNINIIHHSQYTDFELQKREYEMLLMSLDKTKSRTAIDNDLRTIMYVSSKVLADEKMVSYNERFLTTWDATFYDFRKRLLQKNSDKYQFFYIYNPSRLLNKICLERFNADSATISNNIFAYADINYNISSKVRSLIEMIAPIIGATARKNIKLIKELSNIRRHEIQAQSPEDNQLKAKNLPLEELFISIINYYKSPEKNIYEDFVALLCNEDYNDKVINILKTHLDSLQTMDSPLVRKKIVELTIRDFNSLIEESKNLKI